MAKDKLSGEDLTKAIMKAPKNPKFVNEIKRFVRVTSR